MGRRIQHWSRIITDWQLFFLAPGVALLLFPERVPPGLLALALLSLPLLWAISWLGTRAFVPSTPLDIPWLLVLLVLIVSLWATAMPDRTLPQVYKVVVAATLYYAIVNTVRDGRRLRWAAGVLLAGTVVIAGVSLLGTAWSDKFTFLPIPAGALPRLIEPFWNPGGFNPNIVGGTLAVMVPVTFAYTWRTRGWRRLPLLLALGVEIGVLILTQSRGGLLGLALGLAVVALGWDVRWGLVLLGLGMAIVVVVPVYGPQQSLDLIVSGAGNPVASAQGRLELWSRALNIIADFPLTGIGMGMFAEIVPVLYPLFIIGPEPGVEHAHNIFLQVATDYGLPGLIAWLAQMGLLFWMGVEAVRQTREGRWWPLAAGLLGGLVTYLVHGLTDSFTYYAKGHTLVWAFLSLIAALWLMSPTEDAIEAQAPQAQSNQL